MLEYLARRIAKEASRPADRSAEPTYDQFIRTELLTWLPPFAERAASVRNANDFHKAIIALTVAFMGVLAARAE